MFSDNIGHTSSHGHHHHQYSDHKHHHHNHHNHRKHKPHFNNHNTKQFRSELKKHRYHLNERSDQNIDDDSTSYDRVYETNQYQPIIVRSDKWHILPKIAAEYRIEEDADLPPYLKKYNKRNRQLINLLEGTLAPPYEYYTKHRPATQHKHHHKKIKWLEKNLFEEQRPQLTDNQTTLSNRTDLDDDRNRLPGENDIVDDSALDNADRKVNGRLANLQSVSKTSTIVKSSKNDKFVYHRVPSPKLVGAGSFGLLRKQRLPFVAITDKRLGHPSNRAYTP